MSSEQRHLRLNRILLVVAGGSYLAWWLFVHLALPTAFNPLTSRVVVVSTFFVVLGASYAWEPIARRIDDWLAACATLATLHYFYLFDRNEADLNWIIGSYISVTAVCAILESGRALRVYSVLVALASTAVIVRAAKVDYVVFLPGMFTILLFANVGLHARLRLLSQLRESHRRVASLFDAGFEGIVVHDGTTIRAANGALTRLVQSRPGALVGRPLAELGLDASAITDGGEATLVRRDGTRVTVEVSTKPHVMNGAEMRLVALRDLTEQKRAADDLREANQQLETFSYSVAHDLRAPLRGINAFGQILVDEHGATLDAEGRRILDRIRVATTTMADLIDALLDLARVSRVELKREPVELTAIADGIVKQLEAAHPTRTVEFVSTVSSVPQGDPALLSAVLQNLIGNAWKFTSKREHARITLGQRDVEAGPAYFVEDNGAGFDMAYAKNLFAPFHRLHSPTDFPGTGIGLATVQRIIARHRGRVWAEAEPDRGATFYFTLEGEPRAPTSASTS